MLETFLFISLGVILALVISSMPWYVKVRNRFYSMVKEVAIQAAFEVLSKRADK